VYRALDPPGQAWLERRPLGEAPEHAPVLLEQPVALPFPLGRRADPRAAGGGRRLPLREQAMQVLRQHVARQGRDGRQIGRHRGPW
jgi:hypothetical protein